MIAAAFPSRTVWGVEERVELVCLKVFDDTQSCPLEWNCKNPLTELKVFGMV